MARESPSSSLSSTRGKRKRFEEEISRKYSEKKKRSHSKCLDSSSDSSHGKRAKHKKKVKRKKSKVRKKSVSSSSSSSRTNSSSSSESSSSDSEEERRKRKRHKKKLKKKLKKLKKQKEKNIKPAKAGKEKAEEKEKPSQTESTFGPPIPEEILARARAMKPMTKEEWEKKQSVIKRVYDEETGRNRLIKGDGEILEEIVSYDQHKKINRQATASDGDFFQRKLKSSYT